MKEPSQAVLVGGWPRVFLRSWSKGRRRVPVAPAITTSLGDLREMSARRPAAFLDAFIAVVVLSQPPYRVQYGLLYSKCEITLR